MKDIGVPDWGVTTGSTAGTTVVGLAGASDTETVDSFEPPASHQKAPFEESNAGWLESAISLSLRARHIVTSASSFSSMHDRTNGESRHHALVVSALNR
ncbi:MAG TPA: hypothetical protein VNU46_03025 [Gemmatimonadaceae bacterium]|nr:hypothetical protein [Gemmatimonadaceae bacterium]